MVELLQIQFITQVNLFSTAAVARGVRSHGLKGPSQYDLHTRVLYFTYKHTGYGSAWI